MLATALVVLLVLLLLGVYPSWPHSRGWGYWPSSSLGLALIFVVFLVLTDRL